MPEYLVRIWMRDASPVRVEEYKTLTAEQMIAFLVEQLRLSEAHDNERQLFDVFVLGECVIDAG